MLALLMLLLLLLSFLTPLFIYFFINYIEVKAMTTTMMTIRRHWLCALGCNVSGAQWIFEDGRMMEGIHSVTPQSFNIWLTIFWRLEILKFFCLDDNCMRIMLMMISGLCLSPFVADLKSHAKNREIRINAGKGFNHFGDVCNKIKSAKLWSARKLFEMKLRDFFLL